MFKVQTGKNIKTKIRKTIILPIILSCPDVRGLIISLINKGGELGGMTRLAGKTSTSGPSVKGAWKN